MSTKMNCFVLKILMLTAGLNIVAQECCIEIQKPHAAWSKIYFNGKVWPAEGEEHPRPRETVSFVYKGENYCAVVSGPYSSIAQREDYMIISCKTGRLVGEFSTCCYAFKPGIPEKYMISGNSIWDGRTWTVDFDKCVLIEDWSKKEIPMTLDTTEGFFPDQDLEISHPITQGVNASGKK